MNEKSNTKAPRVIAEIGCNHKGDISIAKEMINTAKQFCNVYAVKFQKRNPKELLSNDEYNRPHPVSSNSYGNTYGEHREFLEFNKEEHLELKNFCESLDIIYSTSVWDVTSARQIISLKPDFIKVPSACNLNKKLIEVLCKEYEGDIHLSLGMTTKDEEERIVKFFENHNRNNNLVIYSCTSGYPVPFDEVCINEILRLKEKFHDKVKSIGFSGHHLGIAIDLGAFLYGAEWIERHYTLDRSWKGTDHAASLEPAGLRKLVRDLDALSMSMSNKPKDILDIEVEQRNKLKKNQILWEE
tara:strand:+ start:2127 stop:3023 length:897 start_codon:yes stop_codon:yes gene_type:complete